MPCLEILGNKDEIQARLKKKKQVQVHMTTTYTDHKDRNGRLVIIQTPTDLQTPLLTKTKTRNHKRSTNLIDKFRLLKNWLSLKS